MNCVISVYLAYGMAVYCLASIYYLAMTRSIGTPFKDSLTEKIESNNSNEKNFPVLNQDIIHAHELNPLDFSAPQANFLRI